MMLVDDHEVVRLGLRALFSQTGKIEVVAEAGTVADAIERAAKHRPDDARFCPAIDIPFQSGCIAVTRY